MNDESKKVISKCAKKKVEPNDIKNEHLLVEDLLFDSIGFVAMIVMLEDVYSISFDDEYISMTKLQTVQDVVDYISSKQNK